MAMSKINSTTGYLLQILDAGALVYSYSGQGPRHNNQREGGSALVFLGRILLQDPEGNFLGFFLNNRQGTLR